MRILVNKSVSYASNMPIYVKYDIEWLTNFSSLVDVYIPGFYDTFSF